jgi:four helix bundle protein
MWNFNRSKYRRSYWWTKPKRFLSKLTIAYKEARETQYWIRLLKDTDYLTSEQATSLLADVDELLRIIGSIQKTIVIRNSNS